MDQGAAAVAAAVDELAIRNLIARLASSADGDDVEAYVALFTPDASWGLPGKPRRGHEDIRTGSLERRAEGLIGPGSHTRHVVANVSVSVDGDRATADATWLFYVRTNDKPRVGGMGTYHDDLVRTPAGWRLARRQITIDADLPREPGENPS